jgi:fermentation-respiration switch protein FrsA (DUF1100 family)
MFHPYELAEDHEYTFVRPFEELELEMTDGTHLNAIHFKVDKPNGVVLFWHGNTGNVEVCSPIASHFINRGYATIICDYRSYGKSDGSLSQETLYSDGLDVYDRIKEMYPDEEIVIYGQSLGTGVAVYSAANRKPIHLILEAPYYSIEEIGKNNYPYMPVTALVRFPMRSYEHMAQIKCGITMFHGTDDEVIPHRDGLRLSELNPLAKFVSLQGGGHNGCPLFQEYQDELDQALLGYVRKDQRPIEVIRKSKQVPLPVMADSLASYFSKTDVQSNRDSLWLLYFKKFPRSYSEFQAVFGDGDSTLTEPLEADAQAHLSSFFDAIDGHRQIRSTGLLMDLAVSATGHGQATDILRQAVQNHFLEHDSLSLMHLKEKSLSEQNTFWTFYLKDMLVTEKVKAGMYDLLSRDLDQLKIVEGILEAEQDSASVMITEVADSIATEIIEEPIDSLQSDTIKALHDSLN